MEKFGAELITEAYSRISGMVHKTPILTSSLMEKMAGAPERGQKIYFKAELFQKTGSIKSRGTLNVIMKKREVQSLDGFAGVTTHSSGNMGQALSYASQKFGIPCTVVVPSHAPQPKKDAIQGYGAKLVQAKPTVEDRIKTCNEIVAETGMEYISSHNHFDIMAGEGTVGVELLEQVPDMDALLLPVGGGGIAAGIATYVKVHKPDCKIYCVAPEKKSHFAESLRTGEYLWTDNKVTTDTIADGMRVDAVGPLCFPLLSEHCEKTAFFVTDDQIRDAMKLIWNRMKITVEPSSATTVAVLFTKEFQELQAKNVVVMLCGGNVDLNALPW